MVSGHILADMNALPATRDWELFMLHSAPYKLHDPWFDAEERASKLEVARLGRELAHAARDGLPLKGPLDALFAELWREPRAYDLVPETVDEWVRTWIAFDEASVRRALGSFLDSEQTAETRFAAFAEAVEHAQSAAMVVEAGDVLAFGSLLNFAVAPDSCPVVGPAFTEEMERLTGSAADGSASLGEQYRAHLELARLAAAEMKVADIGIRDMVDVQGLISISSLQVLPHERWEAFLRHAAYVLRNPRFEPEERDRMFEVARRGRVLLEAARGDEPLLAPLNSFLERVFDPERVYNLVDEELEHATRGWALSDEDQLRCALRCFLKEGDEPEARLAAFVEASEAPRPADIAASTVMLMTLGSLLNFVVDPESVPVVGLGRFSHQLTLLKGFDPDRSGPLAQQYRQQLDFARSLPAAMNEGNVGVRDMLDVQILLCLSTLWFASYSQDALWRFPPPDLSAQRTGGDDTVRIDRPPMPYLAVCSCLGYDAPYLHEWIEFHRLVGVERFFLYNNGDREVQRELLAPYVEEGVVVLHEWTVFPPQTPAYNHLLEHHREGARWVAAIDTDEFLFASTGQPLPEVLADYEAWPGVAVSRLTFGTSGHRTKPDGLVTENYLGSYDARGHRHIKTIIDPMRTAECLGPHHFRYEDGSLAVDENHYPILGATTAFTSFSRLRINHYYTRSEAEFRAKLNRLRPDNAAPYPAELWEQYATTLQNGYDVPDETILRHVPLLKQRLAATASPLIRSST